MRITIGAVGKLRSGPEKDLIEHYRTALKATGPQAGMTGLSILEVDDRKSAKGTGTPDLASKALLQKIPKNSFMVVMDETGQALKSEAFAASLESWAQNHRDIVFLIGGADGHSDMLKSQANFVLSLGPATWPHMLARVMLVEQLYRASSILCGHPYHRE